jgi:hypothetical protein
MRPKIVILILIVAIGLVALAAVLKGVLGGRAPQDAKAPEPPPAEPAHPVATSPQVSANSSNSTAILEQLRAAEIAKELDQVRELQADGAANPLATGLLLAKVTHREPEVRKAATDALVQLGDTNAIPGLEQAVGLVENPREKTALMDAIDYLKLPNVMADMPTSAVASATEGRSLVVTPLQAVPRNPRIQSGKNRGRRAAVPKAGSPAQPGASAIPYPAQPQTEPDSPAPVTSPPQDTTPPPGTSPPQ